MTRPRVEHYRVRLSSVWIVPVVALCVGGWLLMKNFLDRGPVVELTLSSAEGLVAGETRVKRLSVELGTVTELYLGAGFDEVKAVVELDKGTEDLLRDDTAFWVVRPRINADGITGLSTLVSGAYIEVAPGVGGPGGREYTALETPPVTPPTTPGLRLGLVSDLSASSLGIGSPVYYNGFRVGKVEAQRLTAETGLTHYELFIEEEYEDLVSTNTRFWNASGLFLDAGANGVSLRAESLETLLVGGVAFARPPGIEAGDPVEDGEEFRLYASFSQIQEQDYFYKKEYLLFFDSSIRGLSKGAPVEFRGIRVGSVEDYTLDITAEGAAFFSGDQALMRVHVSIEPGRILSDTPEAIGRLEQMIATSVESGLRASLTTGNLLTGSLYVSLDFEEEPEPATIMEVDGFDVLPTARSGLVQIEQEISNLMNRLEELPLEEAFGNAEEAMASFASMSVQAETTMASLDRLATDPALLGLSEQLEVLLAELSSAAEGLSQDSPLYGDLQSALDELRQTMKNARELTGDLKAEPNRLIFPGTPQPDLIPGARP